MFRDFHLIRNPREDVLFFPASYRLFKLPKEEGDAVAACRESGRALSLSGRIGSIIAAEAEKATAMVDNSQPCGETDNLCLYVAHDCNLHCTYCYNHQGHVANPGMMMPPEVAESAFRRFFTVPGRKYTVAMYGGEPLLNFHGIKAMVEAGRRLEAERGIGISFSITTNGTVFNRERIKFLGDQFASISVSIDGPKEDHDRHRLAARGSSYDRVIKHLPGVLAYCGDKVSLLGTLTGTAAARYVDLLGHLRSLGTNRVALSPVDGTDDNPAAMNASEYEAYSRQHEALCASAIENGLEGDAPREAINVVANLLTRRKLHRYCNAGCNPAITADGSIYACHGLVGIPEFGMGNVTDADSPAYRRVHSAFVKLDVDQIEQCASCWARYFCGGQCYAQAHFRSGDVVIPDARYCGHVKRCISASINSFVSVVENPDIRGRLYANAKRLIGAPKVTVHG